MTEKVSDFSEFLQASAVYGADDELWMISDRRRRGVVPSNPIDLAICVLQQKLLMHEHGVRYHYLG